MKVKRQKAAGKPGRTDSERTACRNVLSKKSPRGEKSLPADRGACEKESTVQGSE
ncbi:MAG TPA: hypothetical protein GYA07_08635 [Verrucomicrobia bacterium]|nr:hypothetical protein [Verrucomicrobiota bacterium]HOB33066.1 hypothetical protein [Verrucomicrobiota bacterium]HOP97098.1 hypothetical protein [Verrucomicrobiota bacterium]HPU54950.1 hypothetical protein [Verrucomicrobiota bacterium]